MFLRGDVLAAPLCPLQSAHQGAEGGEGESHGGGAAEGFRSHGGCEKAVDPEEEAGVDERELVHTKLGLESLAPLHSSILKSNMILKPPLAKAMPFYCFFLYLLLVFLKAPV